MLSCFVVFELNLARRGGQPLLDLRLFANGPFLSSNITNVLVTFAFFGGIFLFPIYLQNLRGLNAFQAGLLLLPQAFASIVAALIGGRIVDRFGVRVVVIPGLALMAFASWQLSYLNLNTSYGWIQALLFIRGLALGMIIQPLNLAALSAIHPRKFAQASSLFTVIRFVATSLGIAVLATLVQTQVKVHSTQLAGQITPTSSLAQLAARLQALLVLHGASPVAARIAALRQIMGLVKQQGYLMAIQNAFWFVMFVLIAAVVSAFFIRMRKSVPAVAQEVAENAEAEASEATLIGL